MTSVLDVVLKSLKVSTPASTMVPEDKIEELGEAAAASASPAYVVARPSKNKLVEKPMKKR